jgi:hypothetical protein
MRYLSRFFLIGPILLSTGGCHAPWMAPPDNRRADSSTPKDGRPAVTAANPPLTVPTANEALLLGVMEKIEQVSQLDPSATPRLLAELQSTAPEFWPATAEQFRSSLAYHQQLVARNQREQKTGAGDLGLGAGESESLALAPAGNKTQAFPAADSAGRAVEQTNFAVNAAASDGIPVRSEIFAAPSPQPPVSSPTPPVPTRDWRALVEQAASDLTERVAESPASTAEVHQHVTLRMLRLLAGQTDEALEPIPGISPTDQDYWSHQLFALATYLDHHNQPDDKRRAAAAAAQLDEALAHLREVGSLSLKSLTFCKKVHAYGAYDPYPADRFTPGQQLALYVEVENYHSQSTEKGFSTSLGSSYELLDADGQRVAGDTFPDVDDTCRSRRRDFHIQYSLTLPAKIAPGKYRLQLVVRDRKSDKIGNAAIEFDVVTK